jgi:hypothetical protein
MNITNAQYIFDEDIENANTAIRATIDGVVMYVPLKQGNRHYAEIMRQVEEGNLTIAEPDA